MDYTLKYIERFWKKVIRSENGCWLWSGRTYDRGLAYGLFHMTVNSKTKTVRAHRMSYELTHGMIPAGLCVCHHCDNPKCVRPDHLFLGTPTDNMRDSSRKGRMPGKVTPSQGFQNGGMHWTKRMPERKPLGSKRPNAKLTEDVVIAIRAATGITQAELAAQYGVNQSLISLILSGKIWGHVL